MYQEKGNPNSVNFLPPKDLTATKEVLFPIDETQDITEGTTVSIPVAQMHSNANIADVAHNMAISVVPDSQLSVGAELIIKISAISADRTITYGTGISGNSFVVPTGETRYILAKYNGTAFVVVSADVAVVDDNSITHAKLTDDAVETHNIKDANVTHDKLADDAVETVNIKDANVTHDKLADDAVETVNIKDANVTHDKLADDAVETVNIKDANVTHDKLADDAVETVNIKDSNVTTDKIADDAITSDKINAKAVGTTEIDDAAVTGTQIANLAVDTQHLAAKSVETSKIDDLAVSAAQLASDAVETAKIKDANVTLAKLAAATKGNILYYNAGWQVLPIGTSGQTLKVSSGGIPEWTT